MVGIKAVAIPSTVRLKSLGRIVKKSPTALAKQLPAYRKRSKKIECELGGHPYLFHKLSDVVIPFAEAAQLAARAELQWAKGVHAAAARLYAEKSGRHACLMARIFQPGLAPPGPDAPRAHARSDRGARVWRASRSR